MQIASLGAGTTSLTNKELEASVHKIGFRITTANADVPASSGNTRDKAIADLAAICGSAVVKLVLQDGVTNETLIEDVLLKDIAEISAYNEGTVAIEKNTAGTHWVTEFALEVSNNAAFVASDKAKLILTVSGKVANATMDVYAIDHPAMTDTFIVYENKYVNQNTAKEFFVPGHYAVSLPAATLKSIELQYANGRVCTLEPQEVRQLLVDSDEAIYSHLGALVKGIGAWYTMSLVGAVKIKVTCTANANIILTREAAAR